MMMAMMKMMDWACYLILFITEYHPYQIYHHHPGSDSSGDCRKKTIPISL
jgi:hypothetical protein